MFIEFMWISTMKLCEHTYTSRERLESLILSLYLIYYLNYLN